ncbi:MAG: response regulator, partial [Lachnospiraceae bacterium]|nr:response regulator [Lachnospiraceae bacterium]
MTVNDSKVVRELIELSHDNEKLGAELNRYRKVAQIIRSKVNSKVRLPINAMIGYCDLLMRCEMDDEQTEYVDNIRNAAFELWSVMDHLLEIYDELEGKAPLSRYDNAPMEQSNLDFTVLKGRVLIVDDNLISRELMTSVLEPMGIVSDGAENGTEAVECCMNNTYDLILMDYYLKGETGADVIRIIRSYNRTVPIIAFSSQLT